jgi:hypothetical protein
MDGYPVRIGIASGLSPWSGTGFYWWSRIRTRKAKSMPGWKENRLKKSSSCTISHMV